MLTTSYIIGVDVSKAKLDYFVSDAQRGTVANTREGILQLLDQVIESGGARAHVCLEHTGVYGHLLVKCCHERGVDCSQLDSRKVYHYKCEHGVKAKTDRADAKLIRDYATERQPAPTQPESSWHTKLRELENLRSVLVGQCAQLKNSCRQAIRKETIGLHARIIAKFEKEVARLDRRIEELLSADANVHELRRRLLQVQGVGPVTANAALIHLGDVLGKVENKRICSLAGLAPVPEQSGKSDRPWRIRGGRHRVRKALYMAAVSAVRCNPTLRDFYKRLRTQRHKPARCALIAVARKLLCLLNLIAGLVFQPDIVTLCCFCFECQRHVT